MSQYENTSGHGAGEGGDGKQQPAGPGGPTDRDLSQMPLEEQVELMKRGQISRIVHETDGTVEAGYKFVETLAALLPGAHFELGAYVVPLEGRNPVGPSANLGSQSSAVEAAGQAGQAGQADRAGHRDGARDTRGSRGDRGNQHNNTPSTKAGEKNPKTKEELDQDLDDYFGRRGPGSPNK